MFEQKLLLDELRLHMKPQQKRLVPRHLHTQLLCLQTQELDLH